MKRAKNGTETGKNERNGEVIFVNIYDLSDIRSDLTVGACHSRCRMNYKHTLHSATGLLNYLTAAGLLP